MNFENSRTKENLMRAFAGESQARNRYTFGASFAKKHNLPVLETVFLFTANQEKEHAEIFYNHLKEFSGENIQIDGAYPVDIYPNISKLLRSAQHNEYEEYDTVYKAFGETARDEGFPAVSASFFNISQIEKVHGDRFGYFANLAEQNKLFVAEKETGWMCLNCGYIYKGDRVPEQCPVCQETGYFVRLTMAPFSWEITKDII